MNTAEQVEEWKNQLDDRRLEEAARLYIILLGGNPDEVSETGKTLWENAIPTVTQQYYIHIALSHVFQK